MANSETSTRPTQEQTAEAQASISATETKFGMSGMRVSGSGDEPVVRPPATVRPPVDKLPAGAVLGSILWLGLSLSYVIVAGILSPQTIWSPGTLGAILAGICAPLVVVWLVVLFMQRVNDVDQITAPVRKQLHALLSPGAAAEARVKRITQALADQAEMLRHTAGVALDDSSAAMSALSKQSGELKRLTSEGIGELTRIAQGAQGTLQNLQSMLTQINAQTGSERDRALGMVQGLEKSVRECLAQVDSLLGTYEQKLEKLGGVSLQMEGRAKTLVNLTQSVEGKLDGAAGAVLKDLDRLEAVVAELGQRSAAIAHQLGRPVESLETAASRLDHNMRQSQEMLQNATQNLEKVGDAALGRASSLVANLSDRVSSMELVGAKLVSIGAAAQADTGRYVSQIEDAANRIRQQSEQGHQSLRQVLREFEETAAKALERSDSVADTLKQGVDTIGKALGDADERFDALAWDIENRALRIGDLSKDSKAQMEAARLVLDEAQDSFTSQIERLGQMTQRLSEETKRADASTTDLAAASSGAQVQAEGLLGASEKTRSVLMSIGTAMADQQSSVQQMAGALTAQLGALTAALVAQQDVLRQAADGAVAGSDEARAALRAQVQAISEATVEAAGKLDGLHGLLSGETQSLLSAADQLDMRLTGLVSDIKAQSDTIVSAEQALGSEQRTLSGIAELASGKLADLTRQLGSSQEGAVQAMDSVAERLAVLRAEIEKADQMLQSTGDAVSGEAERLDGKTSSMNAGLAEVLQRLQGMTTGLVDAGQTISQQGEAAEALLRRACDDLGGSGQLLGREASAAKAALEEVGVQMGQQQQALLQVQAVVERMSESLVSRSQTLREELKSSLQTGTERVTTAVEQAEALFASLLERFSGASANLGQESAAATVQIEAVLKALHDSADAFAERVDGAENRVLQLQGQLKEFGAQLGSETGALQAGVAELGKQADASASKAEIARETISSATRTLVAQEGQVHEAIGALEAKLAGFTELGESNTAALADLSARLTRNLGGLTSASQLAVQHQQDLLGAIEKTDAQLGAVTGQMRDVQSTVADVAAQASARLSEMAALLEKRAAAGQEQVEAAGRALEAVGGVIQTQSSMLEGANDRLTAGLNATLLTIEGKREALLETTSQLIERLVSLGDGFDVTLQKNDEAKGQISEQSRRTEKLIANLTQMAEVSSSVVDELADRMAALSRQATLDGGQLAEVSQQLAEQQQFVRQMSREAAHVLQSVEQQMGRSGRAGVELLEVTEERISRILGEMTHKMADLSEFGTTLMAELHGAMGQFSAATDKLGTTGRVLSGELLEAGSKLYTHAESIDVAGLSIRESVAAHLLSIEGSQTGLFASFANLRQQLAEIDSRTNGHLVTLQSRAADVLERLHDGVSQLAAMPETISTAQTMLMEQMATARSEISRLRHDLVELGQDVQGQVSGTVETSGTLLANMSEINAQSQQTLSLLGNASHALQEATVVSSERLGGVSAALQQAEQQTLSAGANAEGRISQLLARLDTLAATVDGSIATIAGRYTDLSDTSLGQIGALVEQLDAGASRMQTVSAAAQQDLSAALAALGAHEIAIGRMGGSLQQQLADVRSQVELLLASFTGMDTRLEGIGPTMSGQQAKLESFVGTLEHTLKQVTALQDETRGLVEENLALTDKVLTQEGRLTGAATQLEGKLTQLDGALSGAVLARMQQAVEHAQNVENQMGRITSQTGRLDGALQQIRHSLDSDVRALQQAETGITGVAERTSLKMLEAGTALNATLAQLQRGGQLSQAGLLQANEETQRLVVRLEQVRSLVKNLTGAISSDLADWQFDIKRKMAALATEVKEQTTKLSEQAQAIAKPLAAGAGDAPRLRVAAGSAAVVSPQAAVDALHAISVDLYRIMQAEVPELRQELMPVSGKGSPMSPEESRAFTKALSDQVGDRFVQLVCQLYGRNAEFKQYVERYLQRFEQLYDTLSRQTSNTTELAKIRDTDLGKLYAAFSAAQRPVASPAGAEA